MEENLQNKKFLTVRELIFYSLGLFGLQAIIFYINSYQVEFYSGSGMIEASKMVIVTFIILAAKLVSAVFDPLIGNLIDSKKGGKHGKLKPFIVISTIPLSILTVLIFCKVNLTGFALYAYIFVTTTLWSVAMTLGDVPSQGMSAVITPNPTERNNLIGFSGTLKSIGQAAPYVVVPAVCLCVPGGAGIEGTISTTEYLWCAIVISVLGSLMFLGIFFFNKERVPYEAERVSLKDMFGIIKNNKYLLLVVASYFLGFARQGAMAIQAQTANAILGGANKINSRHFHGGRNRHIYGGYADSHQKIRREKSVHRNEHLRRRKLGACVSRCRLDKLQPHSPHRNAVFDGASVRRGEHYADDHGGRLRRLLRVENGQKNRGRCLRLSLIHI